MQLNLLTPAEEQSLRQYINISDNIVICCHKAPDGDALGSSLAWASFLRQMGKEPQVVVPDAFPDFLKWLPGADAVIRHDKQPEMAQKAFAEAQLIFCLDFNATGRLDDMSPLLEQSNAVKVMFDHHLNPVLSCRLMCSRTDMSSTSEIVFRIIWQLDGFEQLSTDAAVCIYTGMMTDTGGFTYNSTRPEIYTIIGHLLTKNFDKDRIYRNVYNNYSIWALRFRGYMIYQKLKTFPHGHAAYFTITREEMHRFHFVKGDAEGLVNEPLKIRGMKLVISLREDTERPNLVYVSLRSVDDFPCNEMAARFFNGGGHLNASGGKLFCSMEQAEAIVQQAVAAYDILLR